MPLDHALCVITRQSRPGRAWKWARLYLAYGIPVASHARTAKIFLATNKDYAEILCLQTRRYVGMVGVILSVGVGVAGRTLGILIQEHT
jgi:hypothetical protein